MNKLFSSLVLVVFIGALFSGCKGKDDQTLAFFQPADTSGLLASGGTGSTGSGGDGGGLYIDSSGSVKILKSGSVDASFVVTAPTTSFGPTHAVISRGTTTTVLVDADDEAGNFCAISNGDGSVYIGDGNNTCGDAGDALVTGLTVEAGGTLVIVDSDADGGYWSGYGALVMTNDLVVDGTIITEAQYGLWIEANLIKVGTAGKISTSATVADTAANELYLGYGYGITKKIINHGTIEAKGLGSGNGGYMYMEADDLVVNYGTIDVSGGSSETGSGGSCSQWYSLQIYVDYGNFYSSGTVRMNGGNGPAGGGTAGQAWIETASYDNDRDMNGDIIISGTWEAIGGNGEVDGAGGGTGYLGFWTNAMGQIAVNATMTLKGGFGKGDLNSGGNSYGVDFYSYNNGTVEVATPGKIQVAGTFDFRGGDGDVNGGYGGYLYVEGGTGVDVEVIGFPFLYLTGGDGANGGVGGYAQIVAGTVINNSSSMVLSGGEGNTGGSGYSWNGDPSLRFEADHVTNTGKLTANGGKGGTTGGDGGSISINSFGGSSSTAKFSDMSVSGGTGPSSGNDGSITIDGAGPI